MKKTLYLLIQIIALNCIGQNLVPNPSFEQYSICPNNPDQLSDCLYWTSYRESPDYYNECASIGIWSITPPNCFTGFQYPHSGNAFAGLFTFCSYTFAREFMGVQLLSPLVIGQKYFISFYVNLGGAIYPNNTTIASNKMGVKFSIVPYSYSFPAPINNTAHFYSNEIIDDTIKWTRIKGSFIADSTYSYMIIGNFFVDSLTDTINLETINKYANYFIDDVCVTTDSLFNENWMGITQSESGSESVTIYPNPCTTQLTVQYNILPNESATISLLDITGKVIMQAKTEENEFTFNVSNLPAGLYLVKFETGNNVALKKVVKE